MTKLSFEETLIEVWLQALPENARAVKVEQESYPVRRTPKADLPKSLIFRKASGFHRLVSLRTAPSASILRLQDRCALRRACRNTWLPGVQPCMQANAAGRRD